MIQHFQYKSLFANKELPGWSISFYYKGEKINGIYHKNGKIEWNQKPSIDVHEEELLTKQIHELMLFHVYE